MCQHEFCIFQSTHISYLNTLSKHTQTMIQYIFLCSHRFSGATISVSRKHLWITASYSKHNNMKQQKQNSDLWGSQGIKQAIKSEWSQLLFRFTHWALSAAVLPPKPLHLGKHDVSHEDKTHFMHFTQTSQKCLLPYTNFHK